MSEVNARAEVKEIIFEAVVTRADGTVEDRGVISHTVFDSPDDVPEGLLAQLRRFVRNG